MIEWQETIKRMERGIRVKNIVRWKLRARHMRYNEEGEPWGKGGNREETRRRRMRRNTANGLIKLNVVCCRVSCQQLIHLAGICLYLSGLSTEQMCIVSRSLRSRARVSDRDEYRE